MFVAHIMKEENTFHEMYHILDSKIKPLAFHLSDGGDADDSDDELAWTKVRQLQRIKTS